LTKSLKSSLLCPEGAALFERPPPHFSTAVYTTQAIAAGVPVPVVSDWLGHKDGGALLLKTYRHEDESISQKWVTSLDLIPKPSADSESVEHKTPPTTPA
jgi:hypothetical protein